MSWVDPVTRVITLFITAIDVLLLVRFLLKLLGANAQQPFVAALYRMTEPLVRPFQGIFPEPAGAPVLDIAALLAIIFISLIGALVIALIRATRPSN